MSIGTFGSFTQARLAIYAAQTGLTVTGNNISNINTPGYTRQRSEQVSLYTAGSDRYYAEGDVRVGQGVLVRSISQIRSPYLDIRYRTEAGKVGYMDAKLDGLNRIADILDEVGKGDEEKEEKGFGVLGLEISKIFDSIEQLTSQTGHQEYDSTVRANCQSLATKLNSYANSLQEAYEGMVDQLHQDVDKINGYLTTIRSLNEEIRKCDIYGDNALELRDERNLAIDELSQLVAIEVNYTMEEFSYGVEVEKLSIKLSNNNPDGSVDTDSTVLIDGIFGSQLILEQVPEPRDAQELADLQKADTAKADKTIWPYIDDNGDYTADAKDAIGNDNTVNPAYEQYLRADGTPTADPNEARQVDSPNFNITVSELRNKAGRLLYYNSKAPEEAVDMTDANAVQAAKDALKAGGSVTEKVPGSKDLIVTSYRQVGASKIPEKNPNYDPNLPQSATNAKFLKPDGTLTNDIDEANYIENPNVKYYKTVITQTASVPVELDDNDLYGEIQAHRELLTEGGEFTDTAVITKDNSQTGPYRNADENAGTKRGIVYYQRALDLLANKFAAVMNEANQGFRTDPDGNYITASTDADGKTTGVPVVVTGTDAGGAPTADTLTLNKDTSLQNQPAAIIKTLEDATGLQYDPAEDNSKELIDAYLMGQKYDADGNPTLEGDALKANAKGIFDGGVLFSNNGSNNDPTNITAANISVSKAWQNTNHMLVRSFVCPYDETEPASGANSNLDHMLYLVDGQSIDFIPNTLDSTQNASGDIMFTGTFFKMWNYIGGTLGEDQDLTNDMLTTHYENALQIDTNRDSVSAVDFNDEAMNLMMYAKSYNAACRLMTTLDSVIDKLVNNTGLTT